MSAKGKETVVLAYSGGLDTSCILRWLIEKGYDVVAYMANIGQDEDFEEAKTKAKNIGAKKVIVEDLQEQLVRQFVWPAVSCGLLYEGRYLLGTSLARPCISVGLVRAAKAERATFIAHGATAKGNDQVRFELSCYSLWPEVKILAPWRIKEFTDRFQGRQDLLRYAAENGIPVPVTPKEPWSMDANLMHISYESGALEKPSRPPPSGLFRMTRDVRLTPDSSSHLQITFENGQPVGVKDLITAEEEKDPVKLFKLLNKLGGMHGIGRIDIVENRFIGLKSRGVYETPAGKILHDAHKDLEVFCLDKEVLRVKNYLTEKLSDYVYNGFWFSPEFNFVRDCIEASQKKVTGWVQLELLKGSVFVVARWSPAELYNEKLVSMDEHGGFEPADAEGFIKIHAIRLKEANRASRQAF